MHAVIKEFAPAKINLALHVLGRRADGYHELDSVVAFATTGDMLELQPAATTSLSVDGWFASAVPTTTDNLVLKAYAALAACAALPPVAMKLTKNLPVASGIGGGSADAAAALRGLMRLADVALPADMLSKLALSLGADVPVCLHGKACRMQGVGEVITPVAQLPGRAILLVNPLETCGTADVFRRMALKPGDVAATAVDVGDHKTWRNDMTQAACDVLPAIRDVLDVLSRVEGKTTHRMSGSGATCFALFDHFENANAASQKLASDYPHWWVASATLG
jgi:4-diphosphocytidyl-2-C-methyl-D-erythritol kinase